MSKIFSIVFLFSTSLIFALIIISFLLIALGFVCSSLSSSLNHSQVVETLLVFYWF